VPLLFRELRRGRRLPNHRRLDPRAGGR
jgi:hypothetical protein